MIHQLLNLTRKFYVVDCESTGVDPQTDRIVELAFECWEPELGMTKAWRTLVNPGVPIPAKATETHHITDGQVTGCRELMAMGGGSLCGAPANHMWHQPGYPERHDFKPWPTFAQLAANLAKGFSDCDFGGHGVRFDLQIIAASMARANQPWSYASARVIDSNRLEALRYPRSLSDLYEKYTGEKLDGAHGALADSKAAGTVMTQQLSGDTGVILLPRSLPRDLDALHELQWPGRLDVEGKFAMVDGVATCMFGKYRGKPMREIPVDYYDWLIRSDFSDEIKTLAGNAKLGVYP